MEVRNITAVNNRAFNLEQTSPTEYQIVIQNKEDFQNPFAININVSDPQIKQIFEIVKSSGLDGLLSSQETFSEDFFLKLTNQQLLALCLLDNSASAQLNQLPEWEQQQISSGVMEKNVEKAPSFLSPKALDYPRHAVIKEKDGQGVMFVPDYDFVSWEGRVQNHVRMIMMPKTIEGLQNIIKYCHENNLRVRASGYRHTASKMYAEDNSVAIAMVDLDPATKIPAHHPKMDPNNEMQGIQIVGEPYIKDGKRKVQCKIGAGTCNYHFQDWAHDPNGGNSEWAMPYNVIMTEITFGGSNAPICHGAGLGTHTLSDLVTEIEFINPKGELQKVTDKELIKTAAANFGLLGITTSITLELDEMQYANLKTVERMPLVTGVPPVYLNNLENQENSATNNKALNKAAFDDAFCEFVKRCETTNYTEWFWFPLQDEVWSNCWYKDGKKENAVRFPGDWQIRFERLQAYIAHLNNVVIAHSSFLAKFFLKLMGKAGIALMINREDITCTLEDALHFKHGLQNIPSCAMEFEIPVPDKSGTEQSDWSVVQKAWWSALHTVYSEAHRDYFPLRTSLEMRILDGSNVTMAPQRGNKRTCAIEVITPKEINENEWKSYIQDVLDQWALITDDKGNFLNIRPHWAKRFEDLYLNRPVCWLNQLSPEIRADLQPFVYGDRVSIPMVEYNKIVAFRNEIVEFKENLTKICKAGGYELDDLRKTFSNPLLDDLLSFSPSLQLQPDQQSADATYSQRSYGV